MVTRLLRSSTNSGETPYMRYKPLDSEDEVKTVPDHKAKRIKLSELTDDGEHASSDHEQLVGGCESSKAVPVGARARSPSSSGMRLKNRLKQMKAEFSYEERGVADAFIDSTKNQPQYMKDEPPNDLLV